MKYTTKNFISTNESKIYVESNSLSMEEQEKRTHGVLFFPPNPEWKNSEKNVILNNIFHDLEKDYCVMKCVFQKYESDLYKKLDKEKDTQNIKYVRDASMVIDDFFRKFSTSKVFTVIGYSWGCNVVLNILMRRPEITNFILVSPTLTLKNLDWSSFLTTFRANGMIIHGTKDNLTNLETVQKYSELLRSKKMEVKLEVIEGADHYYKEHVKELSLKIREFLTKDQKKEDLEENLKFIEPIEVKEDLDLSSPFSKDESCIN